MDLALHDHLVDAGAAVVDGDEPPHLHDRGAGVDVDDTDVGAVGVGEVVGVVGHLRVQPALDAVGQVAGAVRAHRDLLDRDARARDAAHVEPPPRSVLGPLEVLRRHFEHPGRDQPRLLAHPPRRDHRRGPGHRGRP